MTLEFMRTAEAVAREAGQFLKDFAHSRRLDVSAKGSEYDFVTNADRESQALIFRRIGEKYPQHRLIGEEDNLSDAEIACMLAQAGPEEYFWIVDPLDGTINYIRHLSSYAVSVGLVNRGRCVAGAVYVPAEDAMYSAALGEGAYLNGTPIHASDCDSLSRALTGTGAPVADMAMRRRFTAWAREVAMRTLSLRMLGCAAQALALAACGAVDAHWEMGLHPWDVAAGLILAQEAGCMITDLWGKPYSFDGRGGILVSAPGIHGALCRAIAEAE